MADETPASQNDTIDTPAWFESWKHWITLLIQALFGKVSDATAAKSDATPGAIPDAQKPEATALASFDEAAKFVAVSEGGYSNNPSDHGGPTNFGITQADYSRYLGRPASIDDVKNMPKDVALKIYKKDYWDVMNLDNVIDQGVATIIFSMGILCGTGTVAKWVQTLCKVKVDLKIGPQTISALNLLNGDEFIFSLAKIAKQYFAAIVAKNPSQSIFLKGWNARVDKLVKAFTEDPATIPAVPPTIPAPTGSNTGSIGGGLVDFAKLNGWDGAKMQELIDYQRKTNPLLNPRYWALAKLTDHSKQKRLAVFDRQTLTMQTFLVAHGKNSDPDYDGLATIFSNVNGSNCSSLGIYRAAEFYEMAGHGTAMRLDGLSSTNSNVRARGIVMHKALKVAPATSAYVSDAFVKAYGKCGRSLGCLAIDPAVKDDVIGKLRNGSLINVY